MYDGALLQHRSQINDVTDLETTARSLGLNPIDRHHLEAYKDRQIELHPPSWLYDHRRFLATLIDMILIGCIVSVVVGAVVGTLYLRWFIMVPLGIVTFNGVFVLMTRASVIVKGPAFWVESVPSSRIPSDVPAAIIEAAAILAATVPVRFSVGTLYQERVDLDPYLLAHRDGQRICLGIWDGDRVIACA